MTVLVDTIKRLVEIDVRSLAAVRLLLGLLIVVDAIVRLTDFEIFYADSGLVSLDASRRIAGVPEAWSLFWLSSSDTYQWGLLGATGAAGLWLMVGWRTRWATFVAWILIASLWNRNPLVCNYGDSLLRLLLFWGLFLPWGATWSLDWLGALRRGEVGGGARVVRSWATAAVLMQLSLLYFFSALWKWNNDWLGGNALFHALQLEYAIRPTARWFSRFDSLLTPLTHATLVLEFLGPVAIWIPWRTSLWRLAAMACFVALHVGIELFFSPVYLSYVCVIAWLLLVPSSLWDARWMQAIVGRVERFFVHRTAGKTLTLPPPATRVVLGLPSWANGVCGFFLGYVFLWNLATLDDRFAPLLPERCRVLGRFAMTWQTWDMFHVPSRHNGWFSVPARLRRGDTVDALWHGKPVDRGHPAPSWDEIRNTRWRVFFNRLGSRELAWLHAPMAEYLLRVWNRDHSGEQQALELEVVYTFRRVDSESRPIGFESRVVASARIPPEQRKREDDSPLKRLFEERDRGDALFP